MDTRRNLYEMRKILKEQKDKIGLPEKLVMLDCEMTGVVPERDKLLQAAFVKLKLQDNQYVEDGEPLVLYFKHEGGPENDFHKKFLTHIFEICNQSDLTGPDSRPLINKFLGEYRGATPCGDAVHCDLGFLFHEGCLDRNDIKDDKNIPGTFHFEIFDLNALKSVVRQKYNAKIDKRLELDPGIHDALVDCRNQTKELNFFLKELL